MSNLLSKKEPWDLVAPGYADITMKLFRTYTLAALELAKVRQQDNVVDIACGPGTLTLEASPMVNSVCALDFSQPMINILNETLATRGISNVEAHCGDGQQLPFGNDQFDAAFSMFGLMFFPDRPKAYAEIRRVLKIGGKTVISSWAPVAESSGFQLMFGALRAINPSIPEPQTVLASLENPEFFKNELTDAGFRDVNVHRVTGEMQLKSAEQFWDDMVRASAPVTMFKHGMSEEAWSEKNKIAIAYIKDKIGNKPTNLYSHAWLAVATK